MRDVSKVAAPIECVQKGGDPEKTVIWACGTCKIAKETKEAALECCALWRCDECQKDAPKYHTLCDDCRRKKDQAKAQARYNKAKKVKLAEYGGTWLFCDHCDEFFPDFDSFIDGHDGIELEDIPEWAWGTYEKKFSLDAENIVANELERDEMHEDAFENIPDAALKEMQEFFDKWTEKNPVVSFFPDDDIVVDFEAEVEAYRKEQADGK